MNRFINLRMWIDPLQHTEHRFETFLALFSPLLWHDSIITQYTIDRLISSVVVGTNVRPKSTSTTGAEKQTRQEVDLFFYSPFEISWKREGNRFLSTRFIQGRRRGGRETIVLYLISYWYLSTMCTLIFWSRISNISRSMVGFSREFFHSKRNPLSFNYNIYISDKS